MITYTYDAVGNRTQMNRNGVMTTYTYDANDRLLTETSGALTLTRPTITTAILRPVAMGPSRTRMPTMPRTVSSPPMCNRARIPEPSHTPTMPTASGQA